VLSIGKLGADQARYYLDQAQGRVDVVDSVGDGIEDYYAGGAEARGEWVGAASRELGLHGPVEGEALRRVLAGLDPAGGSLLRSSSSPIRVGGFDLTFSAPKSVSVLFGVGDEVLVRAAHDVAMLAAVAYLERSAAVRRGHGGAVVEEASGFVAAAFRHRTSRAGDPQLHTHVLVANLGRGADGRWSALDGRRMYAHARTASFVYQAVLRSELTRSVGVEWSPVRKGIAEVVGLRRRVLAGFSRRRAEIEAALDQRGTSGARAAEAAALATRRPKDPASVARELTGEWRTRAAELGLGRDELALITGRSRSKEPGAREWDRIFERLAGITGLTRRRATFTRDEVLQAVCEMLPPGARVDRASLEAAADRFLASEHVIALVVDEPREGEAFRRRDGRVLPVDRQQLRYSTRAHLELEQELINRVIAARRGDAGVANEHGLARALSSRPTMTDEQRTAIERLCRDGDGVAVLAGRPGTGKTFALAAAREAWQAAGHPVLGVATARRAAAELQDGARIQSTSTFALLADLRTHGRPMPERCVLAVDEAGMVPTREIAELVDAVLAVEGKVVLVGDYRQLPELQAGGTFRALVQRGLALELRNNVRQVNAWEREALDQLRDGEAEHALGAYVRHHRVTVEPTADATRARLVEDWFAAGDRGSAVMIAHRRVDVADLNSRARERIRAAGQLGPELETPAGSFAVGDHVVIRRNDHRREISNGDRGRVSDVDPTCGAIEIELSGRRIRLDRRFLAEPTAAGDPPLRHGYAITGHIAQGLTVDDTYVLATDGIDREWAYVALSRGRHANRLYLTAEGESDRAEYAPAGPTPDPLERLTRQLENSTAQVLAIDTGQPVESESLEQATLERQRLEHRRFGWLPGRRQELEAARANEGDICREQLERQHGGRPFATDAEWRERLDSQHERELERATERVLRRERGMGREL
jgi:conjugative relaxase-like TrwC/TraI family protein